MTTTESSTALVDLTAVPWHELWDLADNPDDDDVLARAIRRVTAPADEHTPDNGNPLAKKAVSAFNSAI